MPLQPALLSQAHQLTEKASVALALLIDAETHLLFTMGNPTHCSKELFLLPCRRCALLQF